MGRPATRPRSRTVLVSRVIFAETLGEGLGVVEKDRGSVAAAEVEALVDEIGAVLDALG